MTCLCSNVVLVHPSLTAPSGLARILQPFARLPMYEKSMMTCTKNGILNNHPQRSLYVVNYTKARGTENMDVKDIEMECLSSIDPHTNDENGLKSVWARLKEKMDKRVKEQISPTTTLCHHSSNSTLKGEYNNDKDDDWKSV